MPDFRRFFHKKASKTDGTTKSETSEADNQAFGLKELWSGENPVLDGHSDIFAIRPLGSNAGEDKTQVAIVAVHGLNGHYEETWTADNGINWLKSLLPEKTPHARIFSYGYDARTHGFVSQQYLHDHGVALVADLSLHRRDTNTERRPIIFVAHSLGGIICKIALIHANAASENHLKDHKRIHLSTYGILFFGTPHQGGNGISLGKFLVNVASVFVVTNKNILKHLEKHSEALLAQTSQYNAISAQFNTKFFYETQMTMTPLGSKLLVPKYSAVVPGAANAEEIPINSNHVDMVRFRGPEDSGFIRASTTLSLMTQNAIAQVEGNWRRYYMQNGLDPIADFPSFDSGSRVGTADQELFLSGFPSVPSTEPHHRSELRA